MPSTASSNRCERLFVLATDQIASEQRFLATWQLAGHKPPHENESILSLFMNKEIQKLRNRVTRAPDPTTIEFQDIFREIMDAVNASKRRFLFVIDNLDRLPEAEA